MLMCVCFIFIFIYLFNNFKWEISVSCLRGEDKRSCTAVFCKNWGLHVCRLGVCGYRYPWIYPWISTENLWIWIWIWVGNFISTASLGLCQVVNAWKGDCPWTEKKTSRYIVNTEVNSALYLSAVGKSNTDYTTCLAGVKPKRCAFTFVGCQVKPYGSTWQVTLRSYGLPSRAIDDSV